MNWSDFLKTIKEQSPYYNITFAVASLFFLFLPIFLGDETLKRIPEIVAWRHKYLPYILIASVLLSVFGGGQLIKKVAHSVRRKKERTKTRKERQSLLRKLEALHDEKNKKGGFADRKDCLNWTNRVAPLLKFNQLYYSVFIESAHRIDIVGLSADMIDSMLNHMDSQIQMAIEEIKNDIATM